MFGWLDKIPFWRDLPYPTKGALLRAMKAALSAFVSVLVAAATAGTLYPADWAPAIVVLLTAALQALDKFLREATLAKEAAAASVTDDVPDVG